MLLALQNNALTQPWILATPAASTSTSNTTAVATVAGTGTASSSSSTSTTAVAAGAFTGVATATTVSSTQALSAGAIAGTATSTSTTTTTAAGALAAAGVATSSSGTSSSAVAAMAATGTAMSMSVTSTTATWLGSNQPIQSRGGGMNNHQYKQLIRPQAQPQPLAPKWVRPPRELWSPQGVPQPEHLLVGSATNLTLTLCTAAGEVTHVWTIEELNQQAVLYSRHPALAARAYQKVA